MSRIPAPQIITCKQWGARMPRYAPQIAGRPNKIVFHHTDGHAAHHNRNGSDDGRGAIVYARALQVDMMDRRGWIDSGHNFLVMRSGLILQGRWGTISAIERGRMVVSAHCPGQNDNPGIEHEHVNGELMTREQAAASGHLMAWICDRTGTRPTEIYGHSVFYNTSCPSNLLDTIKHHRGLVAAILNEYGRGKPKRARILTGRGAVRHEVRR